MSDILQLLNVRLQLFQENQSQSHQRLWIYVLHVFGFFYLVNIKVNIVLSLKNRGVLFDKVLNELSKE